MITHVWQVMDEQSSAFGFWGHPRPWPSRKPRLYATRELAEKAVIRIVRRAHKHRIGEMINSVTSEEESDVYNEEARAWWLSHPPLTTHRTPQATVFICGEPTWYDRDRRAAYYGCIRRVALVAA